MRPIVTALLLLALFPGLARAADEPGPAALPPGGADGWVRLFDGGDFSGLVIEGDAKVEDGVLVIGGAKPARVSVKRDLGDEFEVRLIYRVNPPLGLRVQARSSSLGGSSSAGTTAPEPPAAQGAAPEWRELRCACRKGKARGGYDIGLESWRDGHAVAGSPNTFVGMPGDPPAVWFEVPAGATLLLRGAAAHPDPAAGSWWRTPWPFAAVLLALLVVIVAAVLLFVRRMGRQAVAPAAPPLGDELPPDE